MSTTLIFIVSWVKLRESTKNVEMVYNNNIVVIFIIILIITIINENVSSEHLGCDNQNGTEIN